MNKQPQGKRTSDKALRIVFSVVLIAAAVGLFLISDAGRELLTEGFAVTDADWAAQKGGFPSAMPEKSQPQFLPQEDFITAVAQDASQGVYHHVRTDGNTASYTISREQLGFEPVGLELSLKDGRVRAFLIVWNVPARPEDLQENAGLIEQDLYAMHCAQIEQDYAWLNETFVVMANALDVTDSVSDATLAVLFHLADDVLADGKTRSDTQGAYEFTAFVDKFGQTKLLTLAFSSK